MNEGINLLEPSSRKTKNDFLRKLQPMRLAMVGILFFVSVTAVILFIMVTISPLPSLQAQEQTLQSTLARSKDTIIKLALINDRTTTIQSLLAKRQTPSNAFSLVQRKLDSTMTVISLQSDSTGMMITVDSSSLLSIDSFLNGLIDYVQNKKMFSQVTLVSLTNDVSSNAYEATVQLNYLANANGK